jgi:hypothetical protein
MDRVFISSLARGEMGHVRQAVKQGVESLDMVPVMFETAGASERASRAELLDKVVGSDVLLLSFGAQYGETGESGFSPTEDEFNAAREHGRPVLTIVQEGVEREPAQEAFVGRVRGTWERGAFAPGFRTPEEAPLAAVRALNGWRNRKPAGEQRQATEARALELARGHESPNVVHSRSTLRVVAAPLVARPLLDAVALDEAGLRDRLASLARDAGLVSNAMGLEESGIDPEGTVAQLSGPNGGGSKRASP